MGVVEGVIKGSLQKHLKTGWVKAKVVHRGEGVLKVSPPLSPPGKFQSYTMDVFSNRQLGTGNKNVHSVIKH